MQMPRATARVWFDPVSEEGRYLPEGPRTVGDALVWVNIQTAPDATCGQLYQAELGDPQSVVVHELPGRPGFALPTDRPGKWPLHAENNRQVRGRSHEGYR